jgi:uncharacterized protein (TIGR02001 family)
MWDLPPPDPGIEISVATRGMSKGISQTDGVQFIPKAFIQFGSVQIGGQWKNLTSPVVDGEAATFISYSPKVGQWQLTFGVTYKFQTNVRAKIDDDCLELSFGASRKFGKVSIKTSGIYSPDDVGSARRSLYVESGVSYDLDKDTRLSVNVGHRSRVAGPNYTSFNAGVSRTALKGMTVDLRYYDTAQDELGESYRGRLVLSGRLAL